MSPLARDLSHLPRPDRATEGEPPDPTPRFVHVLVEALAAAEHEAGDRPTAHTTRIRHSDAGKCARAIGYSASGVPKSNPMDLAGVWVTSLGTKIHEWWQEALVARYPGTEVEVKLRLDGLDASGHADARVDLTDGTRRVSVELKTVGGFSYKMKVGDRGPAEGPSFEHKAQGALNAVADGADELVIAYIATEAISRPQAARKGLGELARFCAEWSYGRDEFEPWAAAEVARLQGILGVLDGGELPARKIPNPELPAGAVIADPTSGRWEQRSRDGQVIDTGTWWACGYCAWQDTCAGTDAGRVPIPVELGGAA